LHLQDLRLSISSLKTFNKSAPALRDSNDNFDLKSDALMQRVRVLFDLCDEEFAQRRGSSFGWESVIDGARARLSHAQVAFLALPFFVPPSRLS
jgi:hypothetical protein